MSLIKFSHTIFALPFAMMGFVLGVSNTGVFEVRVLLLVILCMVFARSAAMAFNRYIDREIDARNPRTAQREIPSGVIQPHNALYFVIANCIGFVIAAGFINRLCLYLAPVALFVILFYSYSKRYTALCHVILGIGLGLAPVGAYIAVTGMFSIPVILLGIAVLFWVAGFDIIYALQDDNFDKSQNLRSIPVWLGRSRGLILSRFFHLVTAVCLIGGGYMMVQQFDWVGMLSTIGLVYFIGSLIYQHSIVRPDDLSRIGLAFFTTNGLASLVFGVTVILDFFF